jgi:methionine-rich copper-binding protein CopC
MKFGLTITVLAAAAVFAGASPFHLTLIDSKPKEEAVLTESPSEIWLRFNEPLDVAKCGIGVRGPAGAVELGEVVLTDSVSMSAKIPTTLPPGEYTVSWLGTPINDHAVRGRFKFTVGEGGVIGH